MERFRIGNDIFVTWEVKKNGSPAELAGKDIHVYVTHPRGREEIKAYSVSGNTISFTYEGLKQTVLGRYTITVDIKYADGLSRYLIQDKCGAFELVGRSCAEEPEETDYSVVL